MDMAMDMAMDMELEKNRIRAMYISPYSSELRVKADLHCLGW